MSEQITSSVPFTDRDTSSVPPTSPINNVAEDPYSAFVISAVVLSINLLILGRSFMKSNNPQNSTYILHEMLKQASLLYVIVQVYGFVSKSELLAVLVKREFLFLPLILGLVTFLLNIFMGYGILTNCEKANKKMIYMVALLPTIFVIMNYFGVSSSFFLQSPFVDLLGGGNSALSYYMSIGFFSACVIFPTVSFIYFLLLQSACSNKTKLEIKDYRKKKQEDS